MDLEEKTLIRDLTQGKPMKMLLSFSFPFILANLLQQAYNMADMVIVGQFVGSAGLSAASAGGELATMFLFFAIGFSSAGQVIISQYLGAGQKQKISRFIGTMFTFLMLIAASVSVICTALRVPILRLMNTPAESFSEALAYATVCAAGLVFTYGYNIVSAVLRGLGDSVRPFIFISIAAVVNIVLDLVLVMGFNMGSAGAAIATVFSQALSFIFDQSPKIPVIGSELREIKPNEICAFRLDKLYLGKFLHEEISYVIKISFQIFQ